jgi:hypothetical protein
MMDQRDLNAEMLGFALERTKDLVLIEKRVGKRMIDSEISKIESKEWSMNVVDFIILKYPQHFERLSEVPENIKQCSVKEVVTAYKEIIDKI